MSAAAATGTAIEAARRIATEVAAVHAEAVDRDGRFPSEAVDALRERGLLSAMLAQAVGGGGASLAETAACCFELGRRCAATAMIFAMHQMQVASLIRHRNADDGLDEWLRRVVTEQRLIASVTSEVGTGGDLGRSVAALERDPSGNLFFEKQAPTVSYGAFADDYLTTLRRSPEADPGEQVLVLTSRERTELAPSGTWDVMGMRGTCSPGFIIRGHPEPDGVLATPFAEIAARSMVPVGHILWSHAWLGIATDAFDRARAFVRAAVRRGGEAGAAASRLSHLAAALSPMRAEVRLALEDFLVMDGRNGGAELGTMAAGLRFNTLKLVTSEAAVTVCRAALDVVGIMGFKNDSPFSVSRHLRDAMSAPLMVANERLHAVNGGALLIAKDV